MTLQVTATQGDAAGPATPSPTMRWAAVAVLSGIAMLATLHVWFNVLKIPLELPSPSLFTAPREGFLRGSQRSSWLAWYIPLLTTAFFALVVLARLTRKRDRWSVLSMTVAGCVAVMIGMTVACWAEHNGFMWHYKPEMTLRLLLSIQGQLTATSFGEAIALLSTQWLLLAIGAAVGAGFAVAAGVPLKRSRSNASNTTATDPLEARTEPTARIVSAVILLILSQIGSARGHPYYMLAAGICIALVWFAVAFPKVEYNFKRLLLGSVSAAAIGSIVQTVLYVQTNPIFTKFSGHPGMMGALVSQATLVYAMIFVMYFSVLTLVFMLIAKITVSLCRRRTSA